MLWDGLLDVVYVYQDMRRSGYSCKLFNEDDLVFLARADRNAFPNGIRREQLFEIPCAMCNFSLQEIGSYLRELFPAGQLFPFEVDNSTKVKDFLAAGLGYAFLPRGMVREELENGTFAEIQPLDFKRMNFPATASAAPTTRTSASERCLAKKMPAAAYGAFFCVICTRYGCRPTHLRRAAAVCLLGRAAPAPFGRARRSFCHAVRILPSRRNFAARRAEISNAKVRIF